MELKLECANCGAPFITSTETMRALGFTALPRRCPVCLDRIQGRPEQAQIITRAKLQEWDGVKIDLPRDWWKPHTADPAQGDKTCRRAIVKGSLGAGVLWSGRMDIYDFRHDAAQPGRIRLMRAQHRAGQVSPADPIDPENPDAPQLHPRKIQYSDTYDYMAIDPTDADETLALIWARVNYKTTLKGLGRQYHAALDTSRAVWAYTLASSCRSGRFGSHMALAIVDDAHPVIGKITGDEKCDLIWSLSYSGGREVEIPTLADVWPE